MPDFSKIAVFDSLGYDPLQDAILSKLSKITKFTRHVVKLEEEGNPQLIAYDYYNDVDLYYVILAFNGVPDGLSIKSGDVLMIPTLDQVKSIVKENAPKRVSI